MTPLPPRLPPWLVAGCAIVCGALSAQPARADATVNGNDRTELLDCHGADALVNGDGNRLVFHGACRSLRVNGGDNVVQIDLPPGATVAIAGHGNTVRYTPIVPAPAVSAEGSGNKVVASAPGEAGAALAASPSSAPPPPARLTPAATLSRYGPPPVVSATGANSQPMQTSSPSGSVVAEQPGSTAMIGSQPQ